MANQVDQLNHAMGGAVVAVVCSNNDVVAMGSGSPYSDVAVPWPSHSNGIEVITSSSLSAAISTPSSSKASSTMAKKANIEKEGNVDGKEEVEDTEQGQEVQESEAEDVNNQPRKLNPWAKPSKPASSKPIAGKRKKVCLIFSFQFLKNLLPQPK